MLGCFPLLQCSVDRHKELHGLLPSVNTVRCSRGTYYPALNLGTICCKRAGLDGIDCWHATSRNVLRCLVLLVMLLLMHQANLHQPWRLNRCTHSFIQEMGADCLQLHAQMYLTASLQQGRKHILQRQSQPGHADIQHTFAQVTMQTALLQTAHWQRFN